MLWDSSIGVCRCPEGKFPFGTGATLKCIECSGRYVQPGVLDPTNASLCACIQENMVFKVSKTGVPSCRCPGSNSIFDFDLNCLECNVKPNSTLSQNLTRSTVSGTAPPPPPPNGTTNGTAPPPNGTTNGTAPPPPPPNGTTNGTAPPPPSNDTKNGTDLPPPPSNDTKNGTAPPPSNGTNPPPSNNSNKAPNGLSGDTLGPFECRCSSDSFWNDN